MSSEKLKKCKKCGEENATLNLAVNIAFIDHADEDTIENLRGLYVVLCRTCGVLTKLYDTEEGAISDWNRDFPVMDKKILIGEE